MWWHEACTIILHGFCITYIKIGDYVSTFFSALIKQKIDLHSPMAKNIKRNLEKIMNFRFFIYLKH